jgi:hypothetical protein
MAVCRQLNAIAEPARQIENELARGNSITPSDIPAGYELRFGIDGRPCPHVAVTELSLKFDGYVLLLGVAERPNFIALDTTAIQVAQMLILVLLASLAYVREQFEHGMLCRVSDPANTVDRHTFDQARDDLRPTLYAQPVHNAQDTRAVVYLSIELLISPKYFGEIRH